MIPKGWELEFLDNVGISKWKSLTKIQTRKEFLPVLKIAQ